MKRNTYAGITVLVTLLLALTSYLLFAEETGVKESDRKVADVISRNNSMNDGSNGFLSPRELERLMNKGPSPVAQLEAYSRYAKYPPHSRPLKREMKDLIRPWRIKDMPMPIMPEAWMRRESSMMDMVNRLKAEGKSQEQILAELKAKAAAAPKFTFSLNRHTITDQETLEARLNINDAGGAPMDAELSQVTLLGDASFGRKGLGAPEYEKTGPGRFLFRWKAPSRNKKYWGNLTLKTRLNVPGISDPVDLERSFYSSPITPARFTGEFSERIQDGSLIIEAAVEVLVEGRYSLHANLYSLAESEPTHWAAVEKVLQKGRQTVRFEFFGKIFIDGGYQGRFAMRDLRGTCENLPFPAAWLGDPARIKDIEKAAPKKEPLLYYMPYTSVVHETRSISSNEFSKAEWESEQKERKLLRLKRLAGN